MTRRDLCEEDLLGVTGGSQTNDDVGSGNRNNSNAYGNGTTFCHSQLVSTIGCTNCRQSGHVTAWFKEGTYFGGAQECIFVCSYCNNQWQNFNN